MCFDVGKLGKKSEQASILKKTKDSKEIIEDETDRGIVEGTDETAFVEIDKLEKRKKKVSIKEEVVTINEKKDIVTDDGSTIDKKFKGSVTMEVEVDTDIHFDDPDESLKVTGDVEIFIEEESKDKPGIKISSSYSFDHSETDQEPNLYEFDGEMHVN